MGRPERSEIGQISARLLDLSVVKALAAELCQAGIDAWIVGGAVRDAALGRDPLDLDLAVAGDPKAAADAVAAATGGRRFELSSEFGTWRVVHAGKRGSQIDVTTLRSDGIEADLAERDFTIGAMAISLADGKLLDPHGGLADLAAGRLRVVSEHSFLADPLRLLRAARIAACFGLEPDPETIGLARAAAHRAAEPAAERLLEELRLLICSPDPEAGLAIAHELAIMAPILPELEELRGVDQGPNHHLDVYDHTIAVLRGVIDIERRPEHYVGDRADEVREFLAERLADGFTRGQALRLGALFHDIGKPVSRIEHEGMIGFPGHDESGAEVVDALGRRLHFSRKLRRHVRLLALHHLRLGFLVHHMPLNRREVYGYLTATEGTAVDVTLLTVADRLAARGTSGLASDKMISGHLELARQMVAAGLDLRRAGPREPLLRGDELARELEVEPGPELAAMLAELEVARYAGEVTTRAEAVAHLRKFGAR